MEDLGKDKIEFSNEVRAFVQLLDDDYQRKFKTMEETGDKGMLHVFELKAMELKNDVVAKEFNNLRHPNSKQL